MTRNVRLMIGARKISVSSVLLWLGICWIGLIVLYGVFGHTLIRLLHKSNFLESVLMAGRASTPVESYYEHADQGLVLGTFWLMPILIALTLDQTLDQKPLEGLLIASSLLVSSLLLFSFLEIFPSLIRPFHLDTVSPYHAYKANYIYDDRLVYREIPFTHVQTAGFRGSHYSPTYDIDIAPATTDYVLDENGFRNSHPSKQSDVVVLGDSYVVFGDNEDDTFVGRLRQRSPGLTFVNLGASGWGPNQYLEVLKKYGLKYKPRYVLFSFFEGNDLYNVESYCEWKSGNISS